MANFIKGILDTFRLTDEDDYDEEIQETDSPEDAEYEELRRMQSAPQARRDGFIKRQNPPMRRFAAEEEQNKTEAVTNELIRDNRVKQQRFSRPETKTAVPLRSEALDQGVLVVNPRSFEDAKDIGDGLKKGKIVLLNFEGVNIGLAQRFMDFAGGAVYALGGQIYQISGYNFLVAPEGMVIDGDVLQKLSGEGFNIPTFQRQ